MERFCSRAEIRFWLFHNTNTNYFWNSYCYLYSYNDTGGQTLQKVRGKSFDCFVSIIFQFRISDRGLFRRESAGIGFGFGANFVLFARETATLYGANNLGYVYPYIFLGYGISGIIGPVTGGLIFDLSGSYSLAAYIAAILSITGAIVFLFNFRKNLKVQLERTLQKIKQAI